MHFMRVLSSLNPLSKSKKHRRTRHKSRAHKKTRRNRRRQRGG